MSSLFTYYIERRIKQARQARALSIISAIGYLAIGVWLLFLGIAEASTLAIVAVVVCAFFAVAWAVIAWANNRPLKMWQEML